MATVALLCGIAATIHAGWHRPLAWDLDVAVPPGSPLDWSRSFPAVTPGGGPLFPMSGPRAAESGGDRTSAEPASKPFDVQSSSSFGLVRILTWDLAAHLSWVSDMPPPIGSPETGRAGHHPPLPQAGDALYWMTLAPLLRLMLHPAAVSRAELLGHLVEIGEPTLGILPSAAGERSLAEVTLELELLIRPLRDESPKPLEKDDPVAAMRSRFAFDQLATKYAHDPVAGFGDRLYLLGDELIGEVAEYVDDPNAFVRRNAASALGRFASPEAGRVLFDLAVTTEDPVVLVRALRGLGRALGKVDTERLVERLREEKDPVLFAALTAAVGRARLESAGPFLLDKARVALAASPRDADVLMAVLGAFCDMRPRDNRAEVLAFLRELERDTVRAAREYQPSGGRSAFAADSVDPIELKAEVVRQLALILRVRLDAGDSTARNELLGLRRKLIPGQGNQAFFPVRTNDTLGDVHPPARFLYIATLAECGEPGAKALDEIISDRRSEASIRGYALAQAPWSVASERVPVILRSTEEDAEMKIQAFEAAADLKHPELVALGKEILTEFAELPAGEGTAAQRYLALVAVRALSRRGALGATDLMPLMPHVKSRRSAQGDLKEELQEMTEELVRRAVLGSQRILLEELIDAMLDVVIARDANPTITDRTRSRERREVLVLISDVRAHKTNTEYLRLVGVSVVERLLGYPLERENRRQGEFIPRVMFEEEVLLALGRSQDPMALELLVNVLSNRQNRHRAAACLGLGILGREGPERTLLSFLGDGDPFVRFCAATSLEHLLDVEVAVDWMYGSPSDRLGGVEAFLASMEEAR